MTSHHPSCVSVLNPEGCRSAAYLPKLCSLYFNNILYFYSLQDFCANGAYVAHKLLQKIFSTMIMVKALFVVRCTLCSNSECNHVYAFPSWDFFDCTQIWYVVQYISGSWQYHPNLHKSVPVASTLLGTARKISLFWVKFCKIVEENSQCHEELRCLCEMQRIFLFWS